MTDLMLYGLKISFIGLVVVFAALTMVASMVRLFGRLFAVSEISQPDLQQEDIPEEVIAVIAASVAAVLDRPYKIKRIHYLRSDSDQGGWSRQGRATIMASHITRQSNHRADGRNM